MSLSAALMLIAAAALAAAVAAQMQWLELEPALFRRRRRRLGLALFLLLLLLGLVHYSATGGLDWIFAPDEDGSWKAVALDGRPVGERDFVIGISKGRVSGGVDDCNSWGFEEGSLDRPMGERGIVTTLALCDEEEPMRRAYWSLAHGQKAPRLRQDGRLELAGHGHTGLFRRCEWRETRPQPTSIVSACLFED